MLDPLPVRTQMHQTCLTNRSHCILHTVNPEMGPLLQAVTCQVKYLVLCCGSKSIAREAGSLEASRAFIHIMDESRADKSCHIHCRPCKTLTQESIAYLMLNAQGLANLGKKVSNSLRKNNRKKRLVVELNSKDFL